MYSVAGPHEWQTVEVKARSARTPADSGNLGPCALAQVCMAVELQTRPQDELTTDGQNCEDCPEINPNPPKDSECPNFDGSFSPPVCLSDGSMAKKFAQIIVGLS